MSEIEPTPSTSTPSSPMQPYARLLRVIPSSSEVSKLANEPHLKDVCLDPTATPTLSWTIGRHPLAEVTIENVNVSRKHAVVKFDAERERWTVSDLKSLNGVHVNGSPIGKDVEADISHGDTVSLGPLDDYKWTFVVVEKVGRGKKRADEGGGEDEEVAPAPKKAKVEVAGFTGSRNAVEKLRGEGEVRSEQNKEESIRENTAIPPEDNVDETGETAAEENPEDVKILEDKKHVVEKDDRDEDAENKNDTESKNSAGESKVAVSSGERLRDRFAAELCCPVCSEVFINPTTLVGCGHVFCSLCIARWRKKKRSDALFCCPTCRVSIKRLSNTNYQVILTLYLTTYVVFFFRREIMGNIYLKNLVDSWAETLTKEQLAERRQALADRLEEVSVLIMMCIVAID